jgi:hypothetical protein
LSRLALKQVPTPEFATGHLLALRGNPSEYSDGLNSTVLGFGDDSQLSDVIESMDDHSLTRLVHDHEHDTLSGLIHKHREA